MPSLRPPAPGPQSPLLARSRLWRPDVLAVSLVMHFLGLALPLALLQIYDRILPAQAWGTAIFLVSGVGLAIVLEAVLRYGRTALFATIGARYEAQATLAALTRLQHGDIATIERMGTAAVSDGLRAIGQVRDFWSGQAGAALYETPFVLVYLGLIAVIGGALAWIPLALFAAAALAVAVMNPGISRAALATEQADRERHDFAWTSFAALGYIKAVGAEGRIGRVWRRINARHLARSVELETRMGWVRENAATFGQLSTVLIVAWGAGQVVAGELTTGALAACTMLAGRSIGPAMASLGYWSQLARTGEAQQRVQQLLNLPLNPGLRADAAAQDAPTPLGEITIDAPTLLAQPVRIAAGEVVWLDTPDTTLSSRLLMAVSGMSLDPEVQVRFNGHPLAESSRQALRQSVVLVSRQIALVPGTLLDNLTLFDARYAADVPALAEALGLQATIDRLRRGLHTDVGPGSAEHLDEGIYQRIAILRALLRRPQVLLLDHPASGLDLDGIKRLAGLLKAMQGETTVLIATFKPPLKEACSRTLQISKPGARA